MTSSHSASAGQVGTELVAEWAKTLDVALYSGTAQQRKALIRKLVKELRVMKRDEIIPTYRIPALVRARWNKDALLRRGTFSFSPDERCANRGDMAASAFHPRR